MGAECMENPLLSAVCPWCGSVEPPSEGGFCPGCHQSREAVDLAWYCDVHGWLGNTATLVIAQPAPTLVAHGHPCPACGFAFDVPPAAPAAAAVRKRRRRRARSFEFALGALAVVGLVLYGAGRTSDPILRAAESAVSKPVAPTPRAVISRAYGYDVGSCLLIYRDDSGGTYVCGEGDVATIAPDGTVGSPSLFP